jgi:hypothetical protein
MNGITSRCISFAQGNKDCLQRVNYEFGLVLGVDEFVDEQCYFLEKEYQHNRALHGYGTVSGLLVSAAETGDDLEVQVGRGIGIDQYGRVFIVRNTTTVGDPSPVQSRWSWYPPSTPTRRPGRSYSRRSSAVATP